VPTPSATLSPSNCFLYFATDVPRQLPDLATVESTIVVPANPTVADVNVLGLRGAHTFAGDLTIDLQGPHGQLVRLFNRACGGADNFDLSLDDTAGSAIPCPPTSMQFHVPAAPLSAFNGTSAAGTWRLRVQDFASGDQGQLDHWGLQICGTLASGG
jgi:subtilisin-like proprotein convertase family protein